MSNETIYAKGLYGKQPREGAPEYAIGQISVFVDDFITFMNEHKNEKGYVNLDMLKGKENKISIKLNKYVPKQNDTPF